jgi:hypothetical protein
MKCKRARAGGQAGARSACLAVLLVGLAPSPQVRAEADAAGEYDVKAAYLVKLHSFVKTPEDLSRPAGTLSIGILGEDPFGERFKPVEGKPIGGNILVIRRLGNFTEQLRLAECHVLFISKSEQRNLGRIMAALGTKPVLTVSDAEGFVDGGGMICMVLKGNRVRLEVNQQALEAVGLSVPAQLLRSAARVIEAPPKARGGAIKESP